MDPAYPRVLRTLGDHLRKRRLDLRLLQREVAPRLEVAEATITSWETNQATPSVRFLPAIIRFLGYDPRPLSATSSATASLGTTVPDRLRAARRRLGLSQAELASQLGVNESTVADWEAGRNRPIRRSWRLLRGFFPGLDG